MSTNPTDCKYSPTHEWYRLQADVVTIGITAYATGQLADITYVELPAVGSTVDANQPCGEIESVKATSELFTVIGGEIVEVNTTLADAPEQVNNDPFSHGWMVKIRVSDASPLGALMNADAYNDLIASS